MARRELNRLPLFKDYSRRPIRAEFAEVDIHAQQMLLRSNFPEVGIPACSPVMETASSIQCPLL